MTAVDPDETSSHDARRHDPNVSFLHQSVARLDAPAMEPFDLIGLSTAYSAFTDQIQALRTMAACLRGAARRMIVDDTRSARRRLPAGLGAKIGQPMIAEAIASNPTEAVWAAILTEDWTSRFISC